MIGRVQLGAEPSDADDQHQRGRDASSQRDLGPATQGCHERQRRRHRECLHRRLHHALPHVRIQGIVRGKTDQLRQSPTSTYVLDNIRLHPTGRPCGRLALLFCVLGHDWSLDGHRRGLGRNFWMSHRAQRQRHRCEILIKSLIFLKAHACFNPNFLNL